MRDPNPKKWYDQTVWIVLFIFLFWPVGIVLVWRSDWHIAVKIVITVVLAVVVYLVWNMQQAVMNL